MVVPLFPPSDRVYRFLLEMGEIKRLGSLRQLGVIAELIPGARHTRWDYTVMMLYLASLIEWSGSKNALKVGDVDLSSWKALLQILVLFWNVGHLPGGYATEKGVVRFFYENDRTCPLEELDLIRPLRDIGVHLNPRHPDYEVYTIPELDYRDIHRILGAWKLLRWSKFAPPDVRRVLEDIGIPFLLRWRELRIQQRERWYSLLNLFDLVRACSSAILDTAFCKAAWGVDLPLYLCSMLNDSQLSLAEVSERLAFITRPSVFYLYQEVYHSSSAQRAMAIVAERVHAHLSRSRLWKRTLRHWLSRDRLPANLQGNSRSVEGLSQIVDIQHMNVWYFADNAVTIESHLIECGFRFPLVLIQEIPEAGMIHEMPQTSVTCFVPEQADARSVGKVLGWFIGYYEEPKREHIDTETERFETVYKRQELAPEYEKLLMQLVRLINREVEIRVLPWPIGRLGVFPKDLGYENGSCAIWAATGDLNDRVVRYVLRRRSQWRSAARSFRHEMEGVRRLRQELRKKELLTRYRRCLVITGSIVFQIRVSDGNGSPKGKAAIKEVAEFDGGIVVVRPRCGSVVLYASESKSGRRSALKAVKQKIDRLRKYLKCPMRAHAVGRKGNAFAFAEVVLA